LTPTTCSRRLLFFAAVAAAFWGAACTAAFGPGYTIQKQEIEVHFVPDPQPAIHIDAVYHLRNDGNQPLTKLELRLPGRRRFHFVDPRVEWDNHVLSLTTSADNPRNVILTFPDAWLVSGERTLRLSVEFYPAPPGDNTFSFASDAFFLPAEGWSPQLLPARGAFAKGGVPPPNWPLTVRVPEGFRVHASGQQAKVSRKNGQQTFLLTQRGKDGYPFVVAGRYTATQFSASSDSVTLWSRAKQDAGVLRQPSDALVTAMRAYDVTFGSRGGDSHKLWIVECPVVESCFTGGASLYAPLISEGGARPSAEMASLDTVMADLRSGAPEIVAAVGPSLASSWLGYGQNPGFYDQDPPLSALPAFAAVRGREAIRDPQVRTRTIERALAAVPVHPPEATVKATKRKPEEPAIVRAKSLLFFFALQDRYGQETFNKAIQHMLYARRRGGFNLDDLIAAFEEETHQNVAEFVRHWMKRPGVPDDFRARYENTSGAIAANPMEATP
jgi:hypothetical protein